MGALLDTANALEQSSVMMSYLGAAAGEADAVDSILNAASWEANRITMRNLLSRAYSGTDDEVFYDGDGTQTLQTRQRPIVSVQNLYIDPDRSYGSDTLITASTIIVYKKLGELALDGDFFVAGRQSVKLEYTAGYVSVPWQLRMAVQELVSFWYSRRKNLRVGTRSLSTQGDTTSYELGIPEAVMVVLKRYRGRERTIL